MPPPLVVVGLAGTGERAAQVARRLGVPLAPALLPDEGLALVVHADRLELQATGPGAPGPISVDLTGGRLGRQRKEAGLRKQPLPRAFGLHKRDPASPLFVVDATAGLARDAALLVYAGARVLAVERSEVIALLVEDGLARARLDPEVGPLLDERLSLVCGDSREVLRALVEEGSRPDAVYLDPMFPERRKSALVKKEMQVLQRLHGVSVGTRQVDDVPVEGAREDEAELLEAARAAAKERVVVKRPRGAPDLGPGVSYSVEGETVRYDVYLLRIGV